MNSAIRLPISSSQASPDAYQPPRQLRVIHFVADDAMAVQAAVAQLAQPADASPVTTLLVLDKGAHNRINHRWHNETAHFRVLEGWSNIGRSYEFYRLCREYQPDVVFIHAPGTHHWCSSVSTRAGVAHVIQVNKCANTAIPYGIALGQFAKADEVPLSQRIPGIIIPNGFGNHYYLPLIRALACLREKRLYPRVFLTGIGTRRDHSAAQQLSRALGLDNQVRIAEHCSNLPFLLMHHQIAIIHQPEQHPTLVAQAMAAGCALIGTGHNPRNQEGYTLINHGQDGLLDSSDTPELLAEQLERLLDNRLDAQTLANNARLRALREFSFAHMQAAYQRHYESLSQLQLSAASA